jgi:hypothetical protein
MGTGTATAFFARLVRFDPNMDLTDLTVLARNCSIFFKKDILFLPTILDPVELRPPINNCLSDSPKNTRITRTIP